VSREWSKTLQIDHENTTQVSGGVDFKLPHAIGIRASAEAAARNQYSISGSEKRVYAEEVTIVVERGRRVSVTFFWKQVWQTGKVLVRDDSGAEVEVPYRVRLQPTFDQTQTDDGEAPAAR
jgi:hypothetical protein